MKTACIIPARGGSKGVPKKNILSIAGKPLITWSIEQALQVKLLQNNVFVSSDCDEILDTASAAGALKIKRPDSISGDKASSETALLHALDIIEKKIGNLDFLIFLQATSPLRTTFDIENAISEFITGKYDSLFSSTLIDIFFTWKKNKSNEMESLNHNYQNRKPRQDIEDKYVENGSIYIFKPSLLRKNLNRLGGKIGTYIMNPWQKYEIDTADDVELCEYYLKNKLTKSP
jgi:CMP-N,N'-diacetyllegionaminic acid synthase